MHASSFDIHLDDTLSASIHLKETIIVYDSDGEGSTDSYIEGYFAPTDPENMRDIGCQTPGQVRTQTDESMFPATPRSIQTQTPRSRSRQNGDISMESIGSKKRKKKSSSRSDLLRSILSEVKDIKKQHGIDSDSVCDDNQSVNSETSIKKETLQSLYKEMKDLKSQGSQDNAATQTVSQQSTQTPFFPEGAEAYPSPHGNIQEKLDEVRYLRSNRTTPSHLRGSHPSLLESPNEARYAGSSGTSPARFGSPTPMTSAPARAANPPPYGSTNSPYQYNDGHYSGTPVAPLPTPRMVTQDDLDAVQQRINRLQNYQISPNRSQPIFRENRRMIPIGREYVQPRRIKLRQFTRSYDDMDLGDRRNTSRRGHYTHRSRSDYTIMDRYHLDDALAEAARTAKQLKKISSRMKHEFREDLRRYR